MPIYLKIVKQEQIWYFQIYTTSRLIMQENSLTILNFKNCPIFSSSKLSRTYSRKMFSRILPRICNAHWRSEGLIFGKIQSSKMDFFAKDFSSVYYGGKILVAKLISSALFSHMDLTKGSK